MKRIIFTLIVAVSAVASVMAADNDTTVYFTVNPPMSCMNCENKIKSNIRFEKGVKEIDASAKDAIVTVKFDKRKTSVCKLIPAFKKIGYEAKSVDAKCVKNCASASTCNAGCGSRK